MKKKTSIVIKGKKGQQLNQREWKLINDYAVEGLLLLDAQAKGGSVVLRYNIEGLVPMEEFLQMTTMSKQLFVVLLRNVVLTMKGLETNHFSKDLIDWSLKTSYVDPSSWRIYFLYVPLQPYEASGTLKNYLLSLVSGCLFMPGDDLRYVQALVQDVNSEITYTAGMLEKLCDRISKELIVAGGKKPNRGQCPTCKSEVNADEAVCPFCGAKLKSKPQNQVLAGSGGQMPTYFASPEEKKAVGGTQPSPQPSKTGGPLSVNEDENGVVTVFRSGRNKVMQVWLEDCDHAGKIPLTKFPFRIGKMEGATDHRIYSGLVSRKHADIIKEQGQYFVVDLDSTNGTFLNGKRLQPGVKEALADGAHLSFADAEFKIHID